MKTALIKNATQMILAGVLGCLMVVVAHGQTSSRAWVLKDIDGNSKTWSVPAAEDASLRARLPAKAGRQPATNSIAAREHQVIEIATGMNYFDGQQWSPSVASFEITKDAFVAGKVQHKIRLMPDLNVIGAVIVTTPDGKILQSTPVGIGLYDAANGRRLLIAAITNCTGVLVSSNQVLYPDAFDRVCADVVYTLHNGSFEQDVVITGKLDPEAYGFPAETTQIQIITEFYFTPEPDRIRRPIHVERKLEVRNRMVSPDFVDETLGFGDFVLGSGRAYTTATAANPRGSSALVAKEYKTMDRRTFLTESVRYSSIKKGLQSLPSCNVPPVIRKADASSRGYAELPMPPTTLASTAIPARATQLAAQPARRPGVTIDYVATITGTQGAIVFQGDYTYLVSGAVYCNAATTIEGGAVFKYKTGQSITLNNALTCKTAAYRPAVFTAVDDDTVGEQMAYYGGSGYTGSISTDGYASPALFVNFFDTTLNYFRFCYAQQAVMMAYAETATLTINHSQFVKCIRGIQIGTDSGGCSPGGCAPTYLYLNNSLMANVTYPFVFTGVYAEPAAFVFCTQSTFDTSTSLTSTEGGTGDFTFKSTNSVFANIGSLGGTLTGDHNGFYSCSQFGSSQFAAGASPFQTVATASHYLTDASGFRDQGLASLEAGLVADLRKKTTYPPVVYSNVTISVDTTLGPQAPRDTDTPDLGYHYDPLDYAFAGVDAEANLTFTPGTAVGWYRSSEGWYHAGHGIHVDDSKAVTFDGRVDAPTYWVRCNTVWEKDNAYTYGPGGITGWAWSDIGDSPFVVGRFLRCSMLGSEWANHISDDYGYITVRLADSEIWGGSIGYYLAPQSYTNCLFDRAGVALNTEQSPPSFSMLNCTMRGGTLTIVRTGDGLSAPVVIRESAFDGTLMNTNSDAGTAASCDYNAYKTGAQKYPTGSHNVTITSFDWRKGPLGNYYHGMGDLVDQGSRYANAAGLYQYTVTTNLSTGLQIKETTSMVDIGYHYVAVTSAGAPIDSDADGIADYLEDADGDGSYDATETDWTDADSDGDGEIDSQFRVIITRPGRGSQIP